MTQPSTSPSPAIAMFDIVMGYWLSRAVHAAAMVGVADHMSDSPRSVEELASATGTHADALYRLLRALASGGVFVEHPGRRFALNPLGAMLKSGANTMKATVLAELGQEHEVAWSNLLHSVRTGGVAFHDTFKMTPWEYWQQHPEHARVFNEAMTNMTAASTAAVLATFDASGFTQLVDVGGGNGGLATAFLQRHPRLRATVQDLPQVVDVVQAPDSLAGRLTFTAQDFFDRVEPGGDLYTLKLILHDWQDDDCLRILKNVRAAIQPGGTVLVLESLVPPPNQRGIAPFLDLNMMVMVGGRERTLDEYARLLEAGGFRFVGGTSTDSPAAVIEGRAD
jgi:hypothetical protein